MSDGSLDVEIRETFKLPGSAILANMKASRVLSPSTRARFIASFDYDSPATHGTLEPVDFSLEKCAVHRSDHADEHEVLFRKAAATELQKTDQSAQCKIVGVPWSEE
jgi:hypothetical protein